MLYMTIADFYRIQVAIVLLSPYIVDYIWPRRPTFFFKSIGISNYNLHSPITHSRLSSPS